jgi:hypothetical protein
VFILELEAWMFSDAWILVFGALAFPSDRLGIFLSASWLN